MLFQTPKLIQALFPSLIWRKETKNKEVWLTFDDGPSPEVTPWILNVLKQEGYISDYKQTSDEKKKEFLLVNLKYNNGIPVIREIARVSKPGRRIYTRAGSIPKIQNGLGISIVSTPKGIMSDNNARLKNVGGEIICKVF